MRQILIQKARARDAEKRGNGCAKVSLDDAGELAAGTQSEAAEIVQALSALAAEHPRKAVIVELSYFGGLTTPEVAGELQLSVSTVEREKRFALAWLRRYMG
jgi:RNA polymerase sigma factor (TIGR02999 family)